jgi:hypothetical protein
VAVPNYDIIHIKGAFRSTPAAVRSSVWVLRSMSIKKSFKGG